MEAQVRAQDSPTLIASLFVVTGTLKHQAARYEGRDPELIFPPSRSRMQLRLPVTQDPIRALRVKLSSF
jgi:hypothetical protein